MSERIETSLCALFLCKGAENTTYTVKVHFSKDTDKTFKDRVQKMIVNECLEKTEIIHVNTLHPLSEDSRLAAMETAGAEDMPENLFTAAALVNL